MRFSQRKGLTKPGKLVQIEGIDQELRNGLWDSIQVTYMDSVTYETYHWGESRNSNRHGLLLQYWHNFFKKPVDTIPHKFGDAVSELREFFFRAAWYEVYDFIEFTASVSCDGVDQESFRKFCNRILERENSGYRFVGAQIAEIASASEVEAIEDALAAADSIRVVRLHLDRAVELFADRKNPDYRNSIKESISAIEALAVMVAGRRGASLGEALAIVEGRGALHGGLKRAFAALYGYSSDADGIRHAALAEPNVSSAEAKFMLVACSAFVHYLIGKASELGIELKGAT